MDSSLISNCPRVVQGFENSLGKFCFINCVLQLFCIFEQLYSPGNVSNLFPGGRIWRLLRCCFANASNVIYLEKLQERIHREFCELFQLHKPDEAGDTMDLFNNVISFAAADYGFIPSWKLANQEIGCCCALPAAISPTTDSYCINVPVTSADKWLPTHPDWKHIPLFADNPTMEQLMDRVLTSKPVVADSMCSPLEPSTRTQESAETQTRKESPRRSRRQKRINAGVADLDRLWTQYLEGRFFDHGADESGFAEKSVLTNEDTVKEEFKLLDVVPSYFQTPFRDISHLRESAIRLFQNSESAEGDGSWYNDAIITSLCTILRTAIKASPMAGSIAVLDAAFLASHSGEVELDPEELFNRWKGIYPSFDLSCLEKILVVVCIPHAEGTAKGNHFALLEMSVLNGRVVAYDSLLGPATSMEVVERRFNNHVEALRMLYAKLHASEKPVLELQLCPFTPQQTNGSDCGAFAVILGYFLGLGRNVQDINLNFPSGGQQIRLFLANLLLEACPKKISKRRRVPVVKAATLPSGLCLRMTEIDKLDVDSRAEREFITHGFALLDHQFNFTDEQVQSAMKGFSEHPDAIQPIRNTLADIAAGFNSSLTGETAPRSMVTDPTCVSEWGLIKQVEAELQNDPGLDWLMKGGRSEVAHSLLRSLPGTEAQFWHRDYCFAANGIQEMPAREVPLFLFVAIQDNTFLDFPSGPVHIPKGMACVVRGDKMHRGAENIHGFMHFRVHIKIEAPGSRRFRENKKGEPIFELATPEETERYNRMFLAALEKKRLEALGIASSGETTGDGGDSRCGGDTSGYDGARSHADIEEFPDSDGEPESQGTSGSEIPVLKLSTSSWSHERRREFLNEFGFVVTGPIKSQPFKDACNKVVQHVEEHGKGWWEKISHSRGKEGGAQQVDFMESGQIRKELVHPLNEMRNCLQMEHRRLTGEPEMNWRPALLRSPASPTSVSEKFADAQMFHRDYKVLQSAAADVGCHSSIHALAEPIVIVIQLGSHKQDVPTGKFIIVEVDAWCSVWFHGLLVHCGSNQEAYRFFNYTYLKPALAHVAEIEQRFRRGVVLSAVSFNKAQRVLLEYIESPDSRPSSGIKGETDAKR